MPSHVNFGGDWTEAKLEKLAKYLPAYVHVLKNKRYKYAYIDAFAGSGYRETRLRKESDTGDLWSDDPDDRGKRFSAGSAVVAMRSEPPFQSYIFIERDRSALLKLRNALKQDFPERIKLAKFIEGDANTELKDLCKKDWSARRAVLFLDPYGMEVEWSTMQCIAATRAIDVWILFPAGIGVNRQLPADGNVQNWARSSFNRLFGTDEWFNRFYESTCNEDLFGGPARIEKVASSDGIVRFYLERLKTAFPHVAPQPLVLCNSNNAPMFALFFAAAHPDYGKTALRIAADVLER
jgi:three-Cys-motif partner protein